VLARLFDFRHEHENGDALRLRPSAEQVGHPCPSML
jgi:hypothetical protein